ncbi:MAG: hypothetical protein HY698_06170 [Deltaproteobacteria bacterium]|nr:hypothetical protein [Deltaproteobacteria bacterium]
MHRWAMLVIPGFAAGLLAGDYAQARDDDDPDCPQPPDGEVICIQEPPYIPEWKNYPGQGGGVDTQGGSTASSGGAGGGGGTSSKPPCEPCEANRLQCAKDAAKDTSDCFTFVAELAEEMCHKYKERFDGRAAQIREIRYCVKGKSACRYVRNKVTWEWVWSCPSVQTQLNPPSGTCEKFETKYLDDNHCIESWTVGLDTVARQQNSSTGRSQVETITYNSGGIQKKLPGDLNVQSPSLSGSYASGTITTDGTSLTITTPGGKGMNQLCTERKQKKANECLETYEQCVDDRATKLANGKCRR